jgi:hypothetical protein
MTSAFRENELVDERLKSSSRYHRKFNQTTSPKQLLPNLHTKTHFKAATSIFLKSQLEKSLKDRSNYLSRALRDVSPQFGLTNTEEHHFVKSPTSGGPGLKPSNSIIKKDTKNDRKVQSVTFASGELAEKTERPKLVANQADKTASQQGREFRCFTFLDVAEVVTKTILQQCNVIRSKHPNSKKLVIKDRLNSSDYDQSIGKFRHLHSKRLRNTSLRKDLDTHQFELSADNML